MAAQESKLKDWLFTHVYRHEAVMRPVRAAQTILEDLFEALMSGDASTPPGDEWSLEGLDGDARALKVADYLAGMTDRYAIAQHRRLFDHTPHLR